MQTILQITKKVSLRLFSMVGLGIAFGVGFMLSLQLATAWTNPTVAPPGGTVSGPLTTGSVMQTKSGSLGVGGAFTVGGNSLFTGQSTFDDSICLGGDCRTTWPTGGSVVDQVGTVNVGQWCTGAPGDMVNCTSTPPPDQVGTVNDGQWCTGGPGGEVNCTSAPPTAILPPISFGDISGAPSLTQIPTGSWMGMCGDGTLASQPVIAPAVRVGSSGCGCPSGWLRWEVRDMGIGNNYTCIKQ
jgi:hypothetical protein